MCMCARTLLNSSLCPSVFVHLPLTALLSIMHAGQGRAGDRGEVAGQSERQASYGLRKEGALILALCNSLSASNFPRQTFCYHPAFTLRFTSSVLIACQGAAWSCTPYPEADYAHCNPTQTCNWTQCSSICGQSYSFGKNKPFCTQLQKACFTDS